MTGSSPQWLLIGHIFFTAFLRVKGCVHRLRQEAHLRCNWKIDVYRPVDESQNRNVVGRSTIWIIVTQLMDPPLNLATTLSLTPRDIFHHQNDLFTLTRLLLIHKMFLSIFPSCRFCLFVFTFFTIVATVTVLLSAPHIIVQ